MSVTHAEIIDDLEALGGDFSIAYWPAGLIDVERLLAEEYGIVFEREPSETGWLNICCPFHEETRPSFGINVETGHFKCYSACGDGTLTDFVMRMSPELDPCEALALIGSYVWDEGSEHYRRMVARASLNAEVVMANRLISFWARSRFALGEDVSGILRRFDDLRFTDLRGAVAYAHEVAGA